MRTLLLNTTREFLNVVNWRDALADVVIGNLVVLKEYDRVIHSQKLSVRVPAVVCEKNYVSVKFEHIFRINHCPRNIFIRDQYTCQYCGYTCSKKRYSQDELKRKPSLYLQIPEMDHVIPSSRGGLTSWDNTVTSCRRCNNRKGNQMPKEANMKLARPPVRPSGFRDIFEMKVGQIHDLWFEYLSIYF